MSELRPSDPAEPGITRRRRGRSFSYAHSDGRPVKDRRTLNRIRALALPPAWREVWICRDPIGHIQAVGTDAAGRRQYRYHDVWRAEQDRAKFERVGRLAERLPDFRKKIQADLDQKGLTRERVLAAAARMLDIGLFRVGGEAYESFGLATLRNRFPSGQRMPNRPRDWRCQPGADRSLHSRHGGEGGTRPGVAVNGCTSYCK